MTRKRRTKNLPPSAVRRREGEGQREGEDQDRWRSTRNEAGSSFLSPEVFIVRSADPGVSILRNLSVAEKLENGR